MDKAAALKKIADVVSSCEKCILHQSRKLAVPGTGNAETSLMLIGEGPGFHENEQGMPFVGASGKFLTNLLSQGGYRREDVFITNVVKCRPPDNREPQPDELSACSQYLDEQIMIINPQVILTLGRFSLAKFLPQHRISQVHGKAALVDGRVIVPMYHPAAALHQPSLRAVVEADFARLPGLIERAKERQRQLAQEQKAQEQPREENQGDAVQLNLF